MGKAENGEKMEGWLYLIRPYRFGLQYSRKRYFILEDNCLKSFKSIPTSKEQEPVRSAVLDSCTRVVDNGRGNHHKRLFFVFTLYSTSNHKDQLKLGATSSEEAARWIHSLQDTAAVNNPLSCSKRKHHPFELSISKTAKKCTGLTSASSSMRAESMTADVLAPSPWKIFGFQNGLRLFKEAKDRDSNGRSWDDHPAIMAIGAIDAASEAVFQTIMSIGPSRTEWDFCFYKGSLVEHIDGHTDIIHIQLYNHWLPWAMSRRDFLLQRYWRREDDGTYVILYHSVLHENCPPQNGYVRACLKSGGFVITPMKQGKECVVKHMLAIDWKFWKSYIRKASSRSVTIRMLERVAALGEMFRAKGGTTMYDFLSGDLTMDTGASESEMEDIKTEEVPKRTHNKTEDESVRFSNACSNLTGLNDAADEFFDVPEPSDDSSLDNGWVSNSSPEPCHLDNCQPKIPSAANFVRKLQRFPVQKKGYVELQEQPLEENKPCSYGTTLPKDVTFSMPCSWGPSDPSSFLIRGKNYLKDNKKIKAKGTLLEMVGADWLKSDKREDHLASRPGGIVQQHAARGDPEFFFVITIQVPGTTTYTLALYYMLKTPLEQTPLLDRFVNGEDAFRNSRFKLIPYISKGSWIVKQSVGRKACLLGQALEINYFRGDNYLEVGVDVGSSTVARGVVSLVLGYLNNLVVEMAFLIQGDTPEELPEVLLGTCRLNHPDVEKSISTDAIDSS